MLYLLFMDWLLLNSYNWINKVCVDIKIQSKRTVQRQEWDVRLQCVQYNDNNR